MKKASKIIVIFIFAMSVFVGVGAVEVFADTASQRCFPLQSESKRSARQIFCKTKRKKGCFKVEQV